MPSNKTHFGRSESPASSQNSAISGMRPTRPKDASIVEVPALRALNVEEVDLDAGRATLVADTELEDIDAFGEDVMLVDAPASVPTPSSSIPSGTLIGCYKLLTPVAKGGMAAVWAAQRDAQRGYRKTIAIKTILPHLAGSREFERMFLDEARIASMVQHPNVVEIYDLGDHQGTLYIAMEWVPGESLLTVLRAGGQNVAPISLPVAARIVAQACAGLHAAHELRDDAGNHMNVVHRDVSPQNILLSVDGLVKVTDFGVAKALGQLHDDTGVGHIKGRVQYMAPERLDGGPSDRRSDVFSLGCVLYEATTGLRPFLGDFDYQIMSAVMRGDFIPPSTLVRDFPAQLEAIIARALAPRPDARFPTAQAMQAALEAWLGSLGSVVGAPDVAAIVRKRVGHLIESRNMRFREAAAAFESSPNLSSSRFTVPRMRVSEVDDLAPSSARSRTTSRSFFYDVETGDGPANRRLSGFALVGLGTMAATILGLSVALFVRAAAPAPTVVYLSGPAPAETSIVPAVVAQAPVAGDAGAPKLEKSAPKR